MQYTGSRGSCQTRVLDVLQPIALRCQKSFTIRNRHVGLRQA
jgi:hypothetical protein